MTLVLALSLILVFIIIAGVIICVLLLKMYRRSLSSFFSRGESNPPDRQVQGISTTRTDEETLITSTETRPSPRDIGDGHIYEEDNVPNPSNHSQFEHNSSSTNEGYGTMCTVYLTQNSNMSENSHARQSKNSPYDYLSNHPRPVTALATDPMHDKLQNEDYNPLYDKPPTNPKPVGDSGSSQPIYDRPPPTPVPVIVDWVDPLYDRPPQTPIPVRNGSESQDIYDRPPQTPVPVRNGSTSQDIYDRPPNTLVPVRNGSESKDIYDRPPQTAVPVGSTTQDIYDRPPQTAVPVGSTTQDIYDRPPQTAVPVGSTTQDIYDRLPQLVVPVTSNHDQGLYDRLPQHTVPVRHHTNNDQDIYDRPPQNPVPVGDTTEDIYENLQQNPDTSSFNSQNLYDWLPATSAPVCPPKPNSRDGSESPDPPIYENLSNL